MYGLISVKGKITGSLERDLYLKGGFGHGTLLRDECEERYAPPNYIKWRLRGTKSMWLWLLVQGLEVVSGGPSPPLLMTLISVFVIGYRIVVDLLSAARYSLWQVSPRLFYTTLLPSLKVGGAKTNSHQRLSSAFRLSRRRSKQLSALQKALLHFNLIKVPWGL